MARDRKPVELKLLNGNPGKEPVVTGAPISTSGKPKPPASLKGEAFAEWCRITNYLESVGRIEIVDYAALIVYCTAWATFEDARMAMEDYGPLIQGRDGGLVKNPASQIMRDSADMMLKFGGRFGFTPKDRQNLGISTSRNDTDGLDDFLTA